MTIKLVKFLNHHSPYASGETAGFDEATADKLVKSGKAEHVKAKKADAPAAPQPQRDPATKPEGQAANVGENLITR